MIKIRMEEYENDIFLLSFLKDLFIILNDWHMQ